MYRIAYSTRFKKDLKRCIKRGLDISILENAIDLLQLTGSLPLIYKSHKLTGNYIGCWECHLQNDWLLVWMQNDTELILVLLNTGSHSDIF